LKALMMAKVENYRDMSLGGRSSFWNDDTWEHEIPALYNSSRTFFALALKNVARISLVLLGLQSNAVSDMPKYWKSFDPPNNMSQEVFKEIEAIGTSWSIDLTVIENLWRRLQYYWNVLPQKSEAGLLADKISRKTQGSNKSSNKSSGRPTLSNQPVDFEDEETVSKTISPGKLRKSIAAVYTPITDLNGYFSPDDLRDCSKSIRKIARQLGLSHEDSNMLCDWALPLIREQSSHLEGPAVEALLGAFHEALLGRLPCKREWPRIRKGVDDHVYAWMDIGQSWLESEVVKKKRKL
jgi:hypothetical protein